MDYSFWIVDIFSKNRFEGTPAAVFLVDEFLDEALMQNLAMEINSPEAIFVRESSDSFEAVCFSPTSKGMPFGNALFAAAKIIKQEKNFLGGKINIVLGAETFTAEFLNDSKIKIHFKTAKLKNAKVPDGLYSAIAGELIVSIATERKDLIIELRGPSKLTNIDPNFDVLKELDYDSVVLTADTHYDTELDYDFCSKVYAPKFGLFYSISSPIAYVKLAAYWADRIGKRELIGRQLSLRGGYSKIEYGEDLTCVWADCVITTKGEFSI